MFRSSRSLSLFYLAFAAVPCAQAQTVRVFPNDHATVLWPRVLLLAAGIVAISAAACYLLRTRPRP